MKKIIKEDIERVQRSLDEAKKQGNAKRVSFLQATLNIYTKQIKGR